MLVHMLSHIPHPVKTLHFCRPLVPNAGSKNRHCFQKANYSFKMAKYLLFFTLKPIEFSDISCIINIYLSLYLQYSGNIFPCPAQSRNFSVPLCAIK